MAKVLRYEDIYNSEFLSPADIPAGKTFRLKVIAVDVRELFVPGKGKNWKAVLTCKDAKRKIAVNKTSAKRFKAAWGEDFAKWNNREIEVSAGVVNGKDAVLLKPLNTAPVKETPEPGANDGPVDDLEIPEDQIPKN